MTKTEPKKLPWSASRLLVVLVPQALLCLLSAAALFQVSKASYFHVDESDWATESKYISGLLLGGDFDLQKWRSRSTDFGELNPNLGKYIIGIPAYLQGLAGPQVTYDWRYKLNDNVKRGALPSRAEIMNWRAPVIIFGVVALLLVYHILLWLTGRSLIAFFGAFGVMLGQQFIFITTYLLMDIFYVCALLGLVLWCKRLQGMESKGSCYRWALAAGALTAAGASVKIVATPVMAPLAAAMLAVWCWEHRAGWAPWLKGMAIFTGTWAVLLYACSPQWWTDFMAIDRAALGEEIQQIRQEGVDWDQYLAARHDARQPYLDHYPQLTNVTRPLEYLVSFPRFEKTLARQIKNGPKYTGSRPLGVMGDLFVRKNGNWITPFVFPLMLLGVVAAAARMGRGLKQGVVRYPEIALLLMAAALWAFLVATMPFPSGRFFAPGKVLVIIFAAYGLHVLVLLLHGGLFKALAEKPKTTEETGAEASPAPAAEAAE